MKITALLIVSVFICFDVLTGWLKALSTGTVDSSIMRKGLFHKIGEELAIIFGYLCEYMFPLAGITMTIPIVSGIGIYIVLMESASIIENICVMNPNLNSILSRFFYTENLESETEEGKHLAKDKPTDCCRSVDGEMGKWRRKKKTTRRSGV